MTFRRRAGGGGGARERESVALDRLEVEALTSSFAPPRWLRDLGRTSWALVGFFLLLGGLIWLLTQTATIVVPVLVGLVVSTVASPVVGWLARHRVPRAAGAIVVVLALVALAIAVLLLVIGGISSQADVIASYASDAADKVQAWVEDAGVSQGGAADAKESLKSAVPAIVSTLTRGLAAGIGGLDVARVRDRVLGLRRLLPVEGRTGAPEVPRRSPGRPAGRRADRDRERGRLFRAYFLGVTIVAVFNAVVVGLGALILDVPLAGTIAVVTAVTAYVPFIGAFVAGTFAVVVALGAKGAGVALLMLIVVILANGLLQNIVQPIAFGATLDLNPLLILVVTISAGSLFGMVGLILAAPLTSAAVHIARDVARARAAPAGP